MSEMQARVLLERPFLVLHVGGGRESDFMPPAPPHLDVIADGVERVLQQLIGREALTCMFRGVSLDRLPVVLGAGVDVAPPDSPFFATPYLTKALEYGACPKLVLAFARDGLKPTYVELPGDTPAAELERHRAVYPTAVWTDDRAKVWLSRFPESSPHVASPYEAQYGSWIPGDPRACLKALILFGEPAEIADRLSTEGPAGGPDTARTR
jgi:hypothetical protein